MGSGSKKKHEVYTVAVAGGPDVPLVAPETEQPFFASGGEGDWTGVDNPSAWETLGFGPGGATAYFGEGVVDPETAKAFAVAGFGPEEAGAWQGAGFDPCGATSWGSSGFLPQEAQAHVVAGLTPVTAIVAHAETHLGGAPLVQGEDLDVDELVEEMPDEPSPCPTCGGPKPAEFMLCESCFNGSLGPCPSCGHEISLGTVCHVCGAVTDAPAPTAAGEVVDDGFAGSEAQEELAGDSGSDPSAGPFADVGAATTVADAGKVSEQAWHEAVTPIPDLVPLGDPRGVPLLIGGADLEKGSATIMAYADPAGGEAHEVLFATIRPEAEAKLLEALAPTEVKLVPQEVVKVVHGRLDADKELKIFEEMVTAAKSVSFHLQAADGIPPHTVTRVHDLVDLLANLEPDTPELEAMVAHYAPLVEALEERVKPDYAQPYTAGGKMPMVTAYETSWNKTVVEYVPDLSEPVGEAKLAASSRTASRVDPTIIDGVATWDGSSRSKAAGQEYVIALPGGYTAVYHPYTYQGQKLASDHFSLRGAIEIHCPGGEGHAKDLVDVLGSLNIVNRPMNGAEAEWTYLQQNIEAQGIETHPVVAKAVTQSAELEENVAQGLMFKHAHEVIGLDESAIERFAQKLALEAEASVLPLRVRMVRDAVAKAIGFGTGQDLANSDAYHPLPRRSGGWMVFDRFDVLRDNDALAKSFAGKDIRVHITGAKHAGATILDIFRNGGVLASTERRRVMGAAKGTGMSEAADMQSGGAKSTFVRLFPKSHSRSGATMVWDDPLTLLRRADWYGAPHDTFGSENAASSHNSSSRTTDPKKVATFSGNNEIMFRDGLDLLGADAPSRIVCTSAAERDSVRKLLKKQGVTMLGSRSVDDVVVA